MGCGSVLGDLFYLTDALIQKSSLPSQSREATTIPLSQRVERGHPGIKGDRLRNQLYEMYGEGQIDEQVFTAFRTLAERGQLRPADLAVHRAGSRRRPIQQGDVEVLNALRGIRSRMSQLGQVRSASAKVLTDLESRLAQLDERIDVKEHAARQSVKSDEEVARQRLVEKNELTNSYERLSAQAQALRYDLARVDELRSQLEVKAVELEAVLARSELAATV
jgi:hypothetical protein